MLRRVWTVAAFVICLLILSACVVYEPGSQGLPDRPGDTGGPAPLGHIAYQPPLLPITISIDTNFDIVVALNRRLVTALGTVTVGGGGIQDLAGKPLPLPQLSDVTQLVICQKGSAGKPCQAYQIGSGRKLRIEMNGSFVQDIERNRITIEAAPGSIINVTDNGPPTAELASFGPARVDVEEFHFTVAGEETDVDLERSRSGTIADLSYDHISAVLKPIHGAKVATYRTYRWGAPTVRNHYPSEQECLERRPEDWRDVFSKDDLDVTYGIFCIRTAEGDLGFLFIQPDTTQKPVAYYVYTHTWVR